MVSGGIHHFHKQNKMAGHEIDVVAAYCVIIAGMAALFMCALLVYGH